MARESRYPLRLPPELYELVKSEAEKADKSMNEYIVWALTQFMMIRDEHEQRISDLEKKIAGLMQQDTVKK